MKTYSVSQQERTRCGNIWAVVGTHMATSHVEAARKQYPDARNITKSSTLTSIVCVETKGRDSVTMEVLVMEVKR